ncbi:MAG: 5'-nucleotidase C-terminal domain-containing protein, partial [Gammaproteobacteria bacterium]|nr:5'-nucleotidase C-terminal domain-containing protein [Gammaproteobacteria bacterium]
MKTCFASLRSPTRLMALLAMTCLAAPLARGAGLVVPPDLLPGELYRVLFVTSTDRSATSTNIADYNAFVSAAAGSQADFASLGTTWSAVASTAAVNARNNTNTNPANGVGVPIYRPDGLRLATGNAGFWQCPLVPSPDLTETGTVNPYSLVWTGTAVSGTVFAGQGLGTSDPRFGLSSGTCWVSAGQDFKFSSYPLYALSGVLTATNVGTYVRFRTFVVGATGELAGSFPALTPVTITFKLDYGVADGQPDPGAGVFTGATRRLVIELTDPSQGIALPFEGGFVETFDNTANPGDALGIAGTSNPGGAMIGGLVPFYASINFAGPDSMLSGDGLPVSLPATVQYLTLLLQTPGGATYVQLSTDLTLFQGPEDTDGDGVLDAADNCTLVANPAQADSDADGYGNRCDGDMNNNGSTNAQDTTLFRQQLGQPSVAPTYNAADINANGAVNAQDITLFRKLLGSPPGPSGLSCAGTIGCPNYVVIGHASGILRQQDACGNTSGRTCESIAGNTVSDALRETYQVDFAITNSGGIRAELTCPTTDRPTDYCPPYTPPPYPITRGQVFTVLPFGNTVVTLTISGSELKAMLENGVSSMPSGLGKFPQVSGLCFSYDISAPVNSRVTAVC